MKLSTKFIIFILFFAAFLPRIIGIGEHGVFADEIIWMVRGKEVFAAVRSQVWQYFDSGWWLDKPAAEPIGMPMAFLGGAFMTFLTPGYSHYSLNITKDFVAVRVPAAIFGSLFIPAFYLLVRKFVKQEIAFVASLLLAVDPIAIALSRWLHQDMALMIFSTLSFLLFLYNDRKIVTISSAFFAGMAIITKPQGLLIPTTIFIYSFINFILTKKIDFKKLLMWLVSIALFAIMFFPFLWKNPIDGMTDYLKTQFLNVDNGHLTTFNGEVTKNPPWYYYFAIFPFRVPESVLIGFLIGVSTYLVTIKKELLKNKYALVGLIYSILFVSLISWSNKKLGIRYLSGIWPYIYLLSTLGLFKLQTFIKSNYRAVYWIAIFAFPILGIINFYPSYYLYYNHLTSGAKHQSLESVGYCDGVKPSIEYLGPKLYHGIKIMLPGCDAAINYYTGYTINRVYALNQKPDYVIDETQDEQKFPLRLSQIKEAGYKEIKRIEFQGMILAKIYQNPDNVIKK